jgi:6-pyruvoyltetrahydropterin/6-carboxytetrahydropterin synthase
MYELSQRFFFNAAHTLHRAYDAQGSRRIHGHTYHAEISVSGEPAHSSGMVTDLGLLQAAITNIRPKLDHQFLNEVPGLGIPTLENLCLFIWKEVSSVVPNISQVCVERQATGDRCVFRPSAQSVQ